MSDLHFRENRDPNQNSVPWFFGPWVDQQSLKKWKAYLKNCRSSSNFNEFGHTYIHTYTTLHYRRQTRLAMITATSSGKNLSSTRSNVSSTSPKVSSTKPNVSSARSNVSSTSSNVFSTRLNVSSARSNASWRGRTCPVQGRSCPVRGRRLRASLSSLRCRKKMNQSID